MQRDLAIGLMRRAITVAETQWPEMADANMEVPLDYFTNEEIAAKERALYETSPLALVASSEIANPHDYLVRNAVGRSVLLTRDEDGIAHAFLNYCRHRGAEPAHGCGNERRFTCPYHAWVYDTKGQLVGMPLRDRYDDLDMSRYGLVELPSEERHGFVWVVLRRDHPIDVAAHLGELDTEIGQLGCDRMQLLLVDPGSTARRQLEVGRRGPARGAARSLRARRHLQPESSGGERRPRVLRRHRSPRALGAADVRQGRSRAAEGHARDRVAPRGEHRLHLAHLAGAAAWPTSCTGSSTPTSAPGRASTSRRSATAGSARSSEAPDGMPGPEEMAARAARAVGQDQLVWEGCGRGLARGAHGYELIGRNERGVQLFHETLAHQLGYAGLRYV